MSALSLSAPQIGLPWFKGVFGMVDWPKAARRLWEWLKLPGHAGATQFKIHDWELAQALGVGRRCIQKALKRLQDLGMINRFRLYGPDGGRVIEIVIPLAGPKPKVSSKAKATSKKTASQSHPIPATPLAPEQRAAAARAAEAAAQQPPPIPPEELPEIEAQTLEWLKRGREANQRKAAAKAEETAQREAEVRTQPAGFCQRVGETEGERIQRQQAEQRRQREILEDRMARNASPALGMPSHTSPAHPRE
jgi:hypothetical protein